MFDKTELMILASVLEQENKLRKDIEEYKALIKHKVLFFGKNKRLSKRQNVRSQISDLADIITKYTELFNNSHTKEFYDEFINFLNSKIDTLTKYTGQFSETEDLSFYRVIKIERDCGDQLKYIKLANDIHDNAYFQLYEYMHIIVLFTRNALTEDELNFMQGDDIQLHQWRLDYKKEIKSINNS